LQRGAGVATGDWRRPLENDAPAGWLMGNEAAKLAAPDEAGAERFRAALAGVGEVNTDPARCARAVALRLQSVR